MRADRDVRTEALELRRFLGERDDRRSSLRRSSGEADVSAVDPKLVHEMEEALLDFERRVADRGTLEAIAECLVVELDRAVVRASRAAVAIPVVDQLVELGLHPTYGALATRDLDRACSVLSGYRTAGATLGAT